MNVANARGGNHGALPSIHSSGCIGPGIHKAPIRHCPPCVVRARMDRDVGVRVRAVVARLPGGVRSRGRGDTDERLSAGWAVVSTLR